MFEREIAQAIQQISSEVLRERPMISLAEILDDKRIPERYKPFFETEVRWWLYNEEQQRAASKRFDYAHPELSSLINYMQQVQLRHARFDRKEFKTVLESAVMLTFNYVCRPQTTLKWYIFRGEPVRPVKEVLLRLEAFSDYRYFSSVFWDWIERKQDERASIDAISAGEFERIIRRIDDQILLSCTVEDLLGIMSPIFDVIGVGDEQQVLLDALIVYFDDKNIQKLVSYLEEFRKGEGDSIGREDFVSLLEQLLVSSEEDPEVDFSGVYQNDVLDEVVRQHLQGVPSDMQEAVEEVAAESVPASGGERPAAEAGAAPEHQAARNEYRSYRLEEQKEDRQGTNGRTAPETVGEHSPSSADSPSPAEGEMWEDAPPEEEPEEDDGLDVDVDPDEDAVLNADVPEPIVENSIREEDAEEVAEIEELVVEEELEWIDLVDDSDVEAAGSNDTANADGTGEEAEDPVDRSVNDARAALEEAIRAVDEEEVVSGDDDDVEDVDVEESAEQEEGPADVRSFIDPMLERKVMKKIFRKDRKSYEAAIDSLNQAPTWRAASQILDELFIKYDVDPYSRTAIRFADSIYSRYLSQ